MKPTCSIGYLEVCLGAMEDGGACTLCARRLARECAKDRKRVKARA